MPAKESRNRNSDEFSEQAMELVVRVSKEASGNFFLFIFHLHKAA
jgi:hypothetical protein